MAAKSPLKELLCGICHDDLLAHDGAEIGELECPHRCGAGHGMHVQQKAGAPTVAVSSALAQPTWADVLEAMPCCAASHLPPCCPGSATLVSPAGRRLW